MRYPRRHRAELLLLLLTTSCSKSCDRGAMGSDGGSTPPGDGSLGASARASASPDENDPPIYPVDAGAPDPLAQRLCDALHEGPAKRKAECCSSSPGFTPTAECVRALSFALRSGAITLEAPRIDACAQAMVKAHEGCDWVGPRPPRLPAECQGLLRGTLKHDDRCRSSLDCPEGLRCIGQSPTQMGVCGSPRPVRHVCGLAVDVLAAYTLQDVDTSHPECAGICLRRVCVDAVPVGAACKVNAQCGVHHVCVADKCVLGSLPPIGQGCAGGECSGDARCVNGQCVVAKPAGESCESDTECRGACDKPDGGAKGTCGKRCGPAVKLGG